MIYRGSHLSKVSKDQKMLEWNSSNVEEFREKHKLAKERDSKTFIYQGNEYVLDYAKYLLEYIDTKHGNSKS